MRKSVAFLLILMISPVIGGLYGVLHDQLTYTVSSEYYTKFKFYQFKLAHEGNEAVFPHPRLQVSVVGVMATWWMGMIIGLVLGLVGLGHPDGKGMLKATLKAMSITVIIAFVTGLVGLIYGYFVLGSRSSEEFEYWYLPDTVVNFRSFIAVGSMHNFSYLGGLIGLVVGIVYSVRQKRRSKRTEVGEP